MKNDVSIAEGHVLGEVAITSIRKFACNGNGVTETRRGKGATSSP